MATEIRQLRSLTGRYEYLMALQWRWPEFWRSLEAEVLSHIDGTAFDQEHWDPEFDRWVENWGVVDEWLREAAWQTLCLWSKGSLLDRDPTKPWFLYVPRIEIPPFQPSLQNPRPIVLRPDGVSEGVASAFRVGGGRAESARQFATRMIRQFCRQLAAYCRLHEAIFTPYEQKPELARHADWTALFQSGKSPKEIEIIECSGTRKRLTQAAIQTAIAKFSHEIGLTLRESTRGRTARGKRSKRRNITSI